MTKLGPRPHYLREGSTINVSPDKKNAHLEGKVLFPASDPDIVDRGTYVNAASHAFAVWNAARQMAGEVGVGGTVSQELNVRSYATTPPDVDIDMIVDAQILSEKQGKVRGKTTAMFYRDGDLICEVISRWVGIRI